MNNKISNLKALFFDFGGCIDGNGIHTRTRFLTAFNENNLILPREIFQNAYSVVDANINDNKLALDMNLKDMNLLFVELMFKELNLQNDKIAKVANDITNAQGQSISENALLIEKLSKKYILGIISNFSGNLEIILSEYKIKNYFSHIVESFHVGYAKPDIEMFQIALQKYGGRPETMLFMGDNTERDILPSKKLGMRTILIHEPNKKKDCGADFYVDKFLDIEKILL